MFHYAEPFRLDSRKVSLCFFSEITKEDSRRGEHNLIAIASRVRSIFMNYGRQWFQDTLIF